MNAYLSTRDLEEYGERTTSSLLYLTLQALGQCISMQCVSTPVPTPELAVEHNPVQYTKSDACTCALIIDTLCSCMCVHVVCSLFVVHYSLAHVIHVVIRELVDYLHVCRDGVTHH